MPLGLLEYEEGTQSWTSVSPGGGPVEWIPQNPNAEYAGSLL